MNQTCFICPGCQYLGQTTILRFSGRFICDICIDLASISLDLKEKKLCKVFSEHFKKGCKCPGCERFLPQPMVGESLFCPYYDCSFVGDFKGCKFMSHPSSKMNVSLDLMLNKDSFIETKDFSLPLKLLRDAVHEEMNTVAFSSNNATVDHKMAIGQAFLNLADRMPLEMTSYLIDGKKCGSLQSKLFQEYIRVLEGRLPFTYKKGKKVIRIDSLLSDQLSLFDGISSFEAVISPKREVKNGTKEFYVGGRSAFHSKPFYMGKLLDVIDIKNKKSLMSDIKEYSFLRLLFKGSKPGTKVLVSHLRVPPHYQMGGMSHINRMRKSIVTIIHKKMLAAPFEVCA